MWFVIVKYQTRWCFILKAILKMSFVLWLADDFKMGCCKTTNTRVYAEQ